MAKVTKYFLSLMFIPLLVVIFSGGYKVSAFSLFDRSCNGNKVQGGINAEPGKDVTSPVCTSNNNSKNDNGYNNVTLNTINDAVNIVTLVAGLFAVIMIMIAGFTYVTAGGNSEDTKNARNRIIYAGVGLVVIALAWTITRFITNEILS
jgi:cytochrome bd-type quinol oxidase subunit 2